MSGLTPSGWLAATGAAILALVEQDELASIDPALNLSPVQPLGQLNGVFTATPTNIWAIVGQIYAAMDPDIASGVQLDNLCALTGCVRKAATKTLVTCNANLDAGTYNAGTLVANVAGFPQFTFVNRDAIVSPGGLVSGVVWISTQTGPIAANTSTLTVITNPVSGWNSITNPVAGTVGADVESDAALRLRRATLLVASGGCTVDSLRTALLQVENVIQAHVLDNNSLVTDGNGQPAKSIQPVVWDNSLASNAAIAQAIWNAKPAGILTYGTTTATATDSQGQAHGVQFTRIAGPNGILRIYVAIQIAALVKTFPSNGVSLVQNAIAALTQTPSDDGYVILPGVSLFPGQFWNAALTVTGVTDILSLTFDGNPVPVNTGKFIVTPFQIATIAPADVTVNVVGLLSY